MRLHQGLAAESTMRPAFGIERATVHAAIIHLARVEVGEDCAQDENSAQYHNRQQRIPEFSHHARRPFPFC